MSRLRAAAYAVVRHAISLAFIIAALLFITPFFGLLRRHTPATMPPFTPSVTIYAIRPVTRYLLLP